jgi:hypothetical protein
MDSHAGEKQAIPPADSSPQTSDESPPNPRPLFYALLVVCGCLLLPLVFGDLLIMSLFESTLTDGMAVVFIFGYLLFWLICFGIYCYISLQLFGLSKALSGLGHVWESGTAKVFAVLPFLLLLLAVGLASFWAAKRERSSLSPEGKHVAREPMASVSVTGLDHLSDHLSVSNFGVNGYGHYRAGSGGGDICCTGAVPLDWHEGVTTKVRWDVTNWRDCKGESHEAIVLVTR